MSEGGVNIPKTKLGKLLDEVETTKQGMMDELKSLENQAAGKPVKKPGTWRHHPKDWPSAT